MERTLLIGDHFFLDRATWTLGRTPKRGDIVAFDYPLDRKMIYVKRIAGIPGDRVSLRNRQLYVNGSAVPEPYAIHSQSTVNEYRDNFPRNPDAPVRPRAQEMLSAYVHDGELVVPQGSYFVLGDNRDDSDDSRYWGLVERREIIGSPVLIYSSFDVSTVNLISPEDAMPPTILRMRWAHMFKLI
jgi:signal peptidase I